MVIRLASWRRGSTEDHQDLASSRAWQPARTTALIRPYGEQIVKEFFDAGQSHPVRPGIGQKRTGFLAAPADPDRGFDAVVAGEAQQASYGDQFGNTFTL
jgi:site-specific DNA recombinase